MILEKDLSMNKIYRPSKRSLRNDPNAEILEIFRGIKNRHNKDSHITTNIIINNHCHPIIIDQLTTTILNKNTISDKDQVAINIGEIIVTRNMIFIGKIQAHRKNTFTKDKILANKEENTCITTTITTITTTPITTKILITQSLRTPLRVKILYNNT